jgi:hypothetical protein
MRLQQRRLALAAFLLIGFSLALLILHSRPTIDQTIAKTHGIQIPSSATNFQHITAGVLFDKGAVSLFEMDKSETTNFLTQLTINARQKPITSIGDPRINGWNVWPTNSSTLVRSTFVPGNAAFDKIRKTWTDSAVPIEMFSCKSPVGDWLHVELWDCGKTHLIKLYTDWN